MLFDALLFVFLSLLGKKGANGGNGNSRSGNGRGRGSNSHSKSWPGPELIRSCETNTSRGNAIGFQYPQVCNCLMIWSSELLLFTAMIDASFDE